MERLSESVAEINQPAARVVVEQDAVDDADIARMFDTPVENELVLNETARNNPQ